MWPATASGPAWAASASSPSAIALVRPGAVGPLGRRLPVHFGWPHLPAAWAPIMPMLVIVLLLSSVVIVPMLGMGQSPHVLYRPSEIDVTLDDVKGAGVVVEEVVKSLNLFLAHKTFKEQMGGTARRAVLFEGPPGTGKTYMAKAMAREAGVPFLFVSSSAFQSMYYGQTNRKIRSYFKQLRKYARAVKAAPSASSRRSTPSAASRSGMGSSARREGITGVVNELLIQLQSFDEPTVGPANRSVAPSTCSTVGCRRPPAPQAEDGARQRAGDRRHQPGRRPRPRAAAPRPLRPLDLLRPAVTVGPSRDHRLLPGEEGARPPSSTSRPRRDTLAALTSGYSPVMIEHLLDEALVWALRRGAERLNWADIQKAKMTEEIGLAQPVEYTEAELRTIATHEAGHATVAHLVGVGRKLEVLSIIKRKDALGLLAHSDIEERYIKTKTELVALVRIAFGGMVAEELFFGESSTGVGGDLAAGDGQTSPSMVGQLGMGGSLAQLRRHGRRRRQAQGRGHPGRGQGRRHRDAARPPPRRRGAARRVARAQRARRRRDPRGDRRSDRASREIDLRDDLQALSGDPDGVEDEGLTKASSFQAS